MTQDKVGGPGMEVDNIETNVTEGGDQASHDPATWSGLAVQVRNRNKILKDNLQDTAKSPNMKQLNLCKSSQDL